MTDDQRSIYQRMVDAGVEIDSYQSDLYVPFNQETRAIVAEYNKVAPCAIKFNEPYVDNIDARLWHTIPFAYDLWWEQLSYIKERKQDDE